MIAACMKARSCSPVPQVQLPDGRVLVGQLQCCDKQGNLVLHNTREYLAGRCVPQPHPPASLTPLSRARSGAERALGLVLVPREHRVAVEAQQEAAQLAESMASAVAS